MADGGAEKFVVIRMPTRWGRGIPNDFIADYVARYPGRAVGFAAVDPTDGTAAGEFERSVTTLGLRGLKLSPVYHGYDPWSPPVWRLYEMADAFRVPVMFHRGGAYDPEAALEWGNPLLLDRVGRAFPRLRMIVAHLGQPMMQETVTAAPIAPHEARDRAPTDRFDPVARVPRRVDTAGQVEAAVPAGALLVPTGGAP